MVKLVSLVLVAVLSAAGYSEGVRAQASIITVTVPGQFHSILDIADAQIAVIIALAFISPLGEASSIPMDEAAELFVAANVNSTNLLIQEYLQIVISPSPAQTALLSALNSKYPATAG